MQAPAVPEPPLTDGVVALRAWVWGDAEAVASGLTDPDFVHHALADDLRPGAEQAADFLARAARRDRPQVDLAVVDAADARRVLGGCSLHSLDPVLGRCGVGYWLLPRARGRGAAVAAVRLLARWALGPLGLDRVELTCGPDNTASLHVAERAGFTREGVLRAHLPQRGGRRDSVVWSVVADLA